MKPHRKPIDERVLAADKAIKTGVMSLKNYNVNDVAGGREYIEADVLFFKFAEGEEDSHHVGPEGREHNA